MVDFLYKYLQPSAHYKFSERAPVIKSVVTYYFTNSVSACSLLIALYKFYGFSFFINFMTMGQIIIFCDRGRFLKRCGCIFLNNFVDACSLKFYGYVFFINSVDVGS